MSIGTPLSGNTSSIYPPTATPMPPRIVGRTIRPVINPANPWFMQWFYEKSSIVFAPIAIQTHRPDQNYIGRVTNKGRRRRFPAPTGPVSGTSSKYIGRQPNNRVTL